MDESRLIGSKWVLPWHIPEDLKHFREVTMGGVVVMGRKTYFSIPEKFRPLPWRRNIVLSHTSVDGIETFDDIDSMLSKLQSEKVERVYIIGGASIYEQFFKKSLIDTVELTLIHQTFEGDAYIWEFRDDFQEIQRIDLEGYSFITLKRI